MIAPACYVIGAAEWDALMGVIVQMPLIMLGAFWLLGLDWGRVEDRARRFFRRRRIRAIRARRVGGVA